MKEYQLQTQVWLPRPRHEVFPFFAEAGNLEVITPSWLRFEVLTPPPIAMRAGVLIDYRIRVHGFPVRWRTEIAEWQPPERFVDVQLRGPYKLWHHTHEFHERDGGTLCLDQVRYRPRGGAFIQWLFVRRDVERIFQYRQRRLQELFGKDEQLATSTPQETLAGAALRKARAPRNSTGSTTVPGGET